MMCVYKIENPLGKIYIGQTSNYRMRMLQYKCLKNTSQKKVQESIIFYGFKNHIFTILAECRDRQELYEKESFYIKEYDSIKNGLNMINADKPSYKIQHYNNKVIVTYTLMFRLSFAPKYQWTKCNRCFNVQTGREIKQVLNSGSIGYCINGKFKSLKYLRTKLEKIPKKERLPF